MYNVIYKFSGHKIRNLSQRFCDDDQLRDALDNIPQSEMPVFNSTSFTSERTIKGSSCLR